jgi:hypothetical protein
MMLEWPTRLQPKAQRRSYRIMLSLALLAPLIGTGRCPASAAQDAPDLSGSWKLVAHGPTDIEWAIFQVKQADGKAIVKMIDAPRFLGKPQIYLEKSPDAVVVMLACEQGDITFKGRLHEGREDGRIAGTAQFRATDMAATSRAHLEKTNVTKVAELSKPAGEPDSAATARFLQEMRKAADEFREDRYKS